MLSYLGLVRALLSQRPIMFRKASILAILPALALLGCTGELTPTGGDTTGGGGVDAAPQSAGEMAFHQNVEPLLNESRPKGSCVTCHLGSSAVGGAIFGPDSDATYSEVLAGPLLADPPANSLLLTKGDHEGNALCTGADAPYAGCTSDEVTAISNWIQMEIDAGNI